MSVSEGFTGAVLANLGKMLGDMSDAVGRRSLDIVDVGGGSGAIAVPLAEAGHRVTVVDPSADALATFGAAGG